MSSSVDYRQLIQRIFDQSISSYYEDNEVRGIVDILQGNVCLPFESNFCPKRSIAPSHVFKFIQIPPPLKFFH